ncbi:MAG: DMT family transporter [Bacteroidales bacterium]|nr:DMT family transporter [Bacteroidales bacterium]MDZ4205420.1 DMT family transporter [Bacteroidales bacterium]
MTQTRKAYLLALISVFFWSTAGSVFAISLKYLNPYHLLLFASLVSFAALLITQQIRKELKAEAFFKKRHLINSALLGFLNPFLYYVVLFHAYSILPAQEAMVLNYLWPIILVLLSIPLLKQRIGWLSILAILVSFMGTVVIAFRGQLGGFSIASPLGFFLATGSSIVWALYWILNMKDQRQPAEKLILNFAFGSLYIIILTLIVSSPIPRLSVGYTGALYIGLFEMGFTFLLWLTALKYSDTTARISNMIFLSPFLSLFFIRIFVGEPILYSTIWGLILIVCGVLLQHFTAERQAAFSRPK